MRADAPAGIGGWLLVLTIGLLAFPGLVLFDLGFNQWPIFSESLWSSLTTPGSEVYHPLWAPLIVGSIVGDILLLLLDVFVLALLFRKSSRFPAAFVAFALANVCYFLTTAVAVYQIPIVAERGIESLLREVVPPLLAAPAWIAYVLASRRVKNTFKAKETN